MHFRSLLATIFASALTVPASAATLMRDDFSNASSGWPNMAATRSTDLGLAIYTDSGEYQLTPIQDQVFGFIAAPKQSDTGDVRIETDMFLYAGLGKGAGGVACRFQDDENFYGFLARGDAQVMIVKVKDGKVTPLAQARVKTVMPGTVDTRLNAQCKGDALSLSVSGGGSISATDGDFNQGRSGIVVIGETMAGTSAVFDNFVLSN